MSKEKTIDYSEITSSEVNKEVIDLINQEDENFHEIHGDKFKAQIREVESPFIIADNGFDLAEANNDKIKINVICTKSVVFTGGSCYAIYEKVKDPAYIIHGNYEEGYNIFHLK